MKIEGGGAVEGKGEIGSWYTLGTLVSKKQQKLTVNGNKYLI
jgi:hypothetical protein